MKESFVSMKRWIHVKLCVAFYISRRQVGNSDILFKIRHEDKNKEAVMKNVYFSIKNILLQKINLLTKQYNPVTTITPLFTNEFCRL